MTQNTYNPEKWTEQDRAIIDRLRKMEPAELAFIGQILDTIEAEEPARCEAMAQFAEQQAGRYKLRTEAGRAAFMEALKAV